MPTAFLTASTFEVLPFLGTPGAATVGHALVWSQSPQGFTLSPITVGPDQFSGVLPVSKGGWGTNTGSFTSPGAITLTSGGADQNIALNPSGESGSVAIKNNLRITIGGNSRDGLNLVTAGSAFATLGNGAGGSNFVPFFWSQGTIPGVTSLGFQAQQVGATNNVYSVMAFLAAADDGVSPIAGGNNAFGFFNGASVANPLLRIAASGDSRFFSTTESTSTTTGAVRIDGGLGVAKSLYAAATAGSKVNFANLPTASTGLNPGDLWRDSNGFLRIV